MAKNKLENVWKMLKFYDFSANVTDKDLFCLFCRKLMINSYNGPCGCRFCLDCLINYLKDGENFCPGNLEECKTELLKVNKNVFYDNPINVKISKLIVKCPGKCCEFKDELRNIEDHLQICNNRSINCPYANIGCDKTKISQSNIAEHLQVGMINHTKLLMDSIDHLKNEIGTLKIIIDNLNKENKNLTNKIDEIILDSDNKQIIIQELQRKFDEQNCEIDLLNEDMVALRNVDKYVRDDFDELKLDLRRNQMNIAALQNKCAQQNEQNEQFNNKYQEIENKLVSAKSEKINKEGDLMKPNKIDKSMKNIENSLYYTENILKNGEFVWKIDKINEKMQDAKNGINTVIYSDSFYTHKYGYKMCLRVDPYGCVDGEGTHLSVYFCLMKGEYDDDLLWPFKFDVTFSLINQRTRLPHISYAIKYIQDLNFDNWGKPNSEKDLGLGKPEFIKLDELSNNEGLTVNNQIFMKCAVNINNVNRLLELEKNVIELNYGEFIWRINQINEKINDSKNGINTTIYSDSFYTHKHGYKMCLRMDPNGDGSGTGSYLSVFFCLMKGEYDDIIEWPFKFDVTFSLINQQTRFAYISRTAKFRLTNVIYFNKPINERNVAFGFPQFMKLDELLTNGNLVINNQIFIKYTANNSS